MAEKTTVLQRSSLEGSQMRLSNRGSHDLNGPDKTGDGAAPVAIMIEPLISSCLTHEKKTSLRWSGQDQARWNGRQV